MAALALRGPGLPELNLESHPHSRLEQQPDEALSRFSVVQAAENRDKGPSNDEGVKVCGVAQGPPNQFNKRSNRSFD